MRPRMLSRFEIRHFNLFSPILAHLSQRLLWVFLIKICLASVLLLVVVESFTFHITIFFEPLGQFPDVAQSTFGSLLIKSHTNFYGEIILIRWKYIHWQLLKVFYRITKPIQPNLAQIILLAKGNSDLFKWRTLTFSKGKYMQL